MQRPWVLALAAGVIVLLVALALPLLRMGGVGGGGGSLAGEDGAAATGLPWQVTRLPEGRAQVFGLEPGRDTLAQVQTRLGDALQVAVVARLGESGALEALADPFVAGFISGRLVLAFDVPASQLDAWRAGAASSEPMEGGVRRFKLRAADRQQATQARLVGLSFIPALGRCCFSSKSASSGQISCQSSGRKSLQVTAPSVADSIALHRAIGTGRCPSDH